eukprot:687348-Amorphochlora_amoeboformis.AAC.1
MSHRGRWMGHVAYAYSYTLAWPLGLGLGERERRERGERGRDREKASDRERRARWKIEKSRRCVGSLFALGLGYMYVPKGRLGSVV